MSVLLKILDLIGRLIFLIVIFIIAGFKIFEKVWDKLTIDTKK